MGGGEGTPFTQLYALWQQSFLAFRLTLKCQLFLSLEPDGFQMRTCTITSSSFQALGFRVELHSWAPGCLAC